MKQHVQDMRFKIQREGESKVRAGAYPQVKLFHTSCISQLIIIKLKSLIDSESGICMYMYHMTYHMTCMYMYAYTSG